MDGRGYGGKLAEAAAAPTNGDGEVSGQGGVAVGVGFPANERLKQRVREGREGPGIKKRKEWRGTVNGNGCNLPVDLVGSGELFSLVSLIESERGWMGLLWARGGVGSCVWQGGRMGGGL